MIKATRAETTWVEDRAAILAHLGASARELRRWAKPTWAAAQMAFWPMRVREGTATVIKPFASAVRVKP